MNPLDRLKALIPDITDDSKDTLLLEALLEQAKDTILVYCNRTEMVRGLENAQVQLALVYYNRQGMEGEQSHGEGGISRSFFAGDVSPDIQCQLNAYRLLRAVMRE